MTSLEDIAEYAVININTRINHDKNSLVFGECGYDSLSRYMQECMSIESLTKFGWYIEVEDLGSQNTLDFGNQRWWVVAKRAIEGFPIQHVRRPLCEQSAKAILTVLSVWSLSNPDLGIKLSSLNRASIPPQSCVPT